jgi:ABC-2 type transport system ATP-binding protein
MINIKNLHISFDSKTVLNNISIEFDGPKIIGIAGLNGAGKSTFFNALSGVIKTNKGVITYHQNDFNYDTIAYLETSNFFYSNITGNEYLNIFKNTNSQFQLATFQFHFKLPLDDLIETYSTGMKKKLALLGILKQDKQIYLFDEPFNGLDLESNKILEWVITALFNKGKTIFISSHIIDPLLAICHQICYLEDGQFTRTFLKDEFNEVEDAIFGKLKQQAQQGIQDAI